jgi:hypothetical protein
MKRTAILLSGLLLAGTLHGADSGLRMSSPVLGYIFDDSAKAIRGISGVPGAASLGATVSLPASLASAYVHSSGENAVVVTKEGTLAYAEWSGDARLVPLETTVGALALAAFNGSGKFAVSDGSTIEVWSNAGSPALVSRYHADSAVTALAMDGQGDVIAASGSSLIRFSDRGSETIATGAEWSAVAIPDGTSIIAADETHRELVRIGADGGRSVIASLPERVSAIAGSTNGESFIAALPNGLLAISAAAVTPVACGCAPKGLDPLRGTLTAYVRGTQLLLDVSGSEPQLTRLPRLISVNTGGAN